MVWERKMRSQRARQEIGNPIRAKGTQDENEPGRGKEAVMTFKDSLFVGERNLRVRAVAFPFSLAAHFLFGLLGLSRRPPFPFGDVFPE